MRKMDGCGTVRRAAAVCAAGLMLTALWGCCAAGTDGPGGLAVVGGERVAYRCGDEATVAAAYYRLSDGSLDFVRLDIVRLNEGLKDGVPLRTRYTLPRAVSGSGARYTDGMELVWWAKGDTAMAQRRDDGGQWRTLWDECIPVRAER